MKGNLLIGTGIVLMIISIVGAIVSTKAYGGNLVPQSTPEALNDLVVAMFLLTGVVMHTVGRTINAWVKLPA